jgi:class 3 adenylate cyclase/tetratricopeptide (TPR) repeat protein
MAAADGLNLGATSRPVPSALSCPACGTPTVPGARFCFACGVPLDPTQLGNAEGAERRVVTVLFGDLSDFTAWAEDLDPERVGQVIDRVLAALADVVAAMGGHVDKLTGDGIMAVFGAPTAHEDDAARAVRAAAGMQDVVRKLVADESGGGRRLALRVGLNTGEVLAGVQASLAYTVVGDTVNTASRLSDAAGIGAVLAGRNTAVATMSVASWRTLPPLRLKGKRDPVPAYELVGLRPASSARLGLGDEAPLIGRDGELGALIGDVLDVTAAGKPAAVALTGEAGVGKSRLVAELLRFVAELPDSRVLRTRASSYGAARSLAPLADLVRMACGISDDSDPAEAAARVQRAVIRLAHPSRGSLVPSALSERLLMLIGAAPSDGAPPQDSAIGAEESAGSGLLDSVTSLLQVLLDGVGRRGPLVIVLEDAQWATPSLLSAFSTMLDGLRGPVLLLLCARDDLPELPGLPLRRQLRLAPLDDLAASRLLRAYLADSPLPDGVAQQLLARTRGNPYFLAELLHLLVDRGVLVQDENGWRVEGSLPADPLPAGVHAVLAARIDELPGPVRAVLRGAAVLGSRFPAAALPAVERRSLRDVDAALGALVDRQLVRPPEPGGVFHSFTHPMTRDVAYAGLPKSERARRHARAAAWAAEHLDDDRWRHSGPLPGGDELRELIAEHAERAVDLARSLPLPASHPAWTVRSLGVRALRRLGRSALDGRDYPAALKLLERAGTLARSGAEGGSVLQRDLPEIGLLLGRTLAALHRLDEAERMLRPPLAADDAHQRVAALQLLADIRHQQGRDDAAMDLLLQALRLSEEAGDERTVGTVLRSVGRQDYYAGRLAAAEEHFRESLALARRLGDRRGEAWSLQHLGWDMVGRGDYQLAEQCLTEAVGIFAELDDAAGLAWCTGAGAMLHLLQGRLQLARGEISELLPVAEALGERWGRAALLLLNAVAVAEQGEGDEALALATEATAAFEEIADSWGASVSQLALGLALRAAGRPAQSLQQLRRAVADARRGGHPLTAMLALLPLGMAAVEAGEFEEAERAVQDALRDLSGLEVQPRLLLGVKLLQAELALVRGDAEAALTILTACLEEDDGQPTLLFPRGYVLASRSRALAALGRQAEAREAAAAAVRCSGEDSRSRHAAEEALAAVS